MEHPTIDRGRLLEDLKTLRGFGFQSPGVVRQSLSPVDVESRRWLVGRFAEAGLEAGIDGIGNVYGRSANAGPALLMGSHSDTQPTGGWLDGALGVVYGLEVARALAECPETRGLAIDVASWIDEEGHFQSCLGSRSFCGLLDEAAADTLTDSEGRTLREALREAGLEGRVHWSLDESRYVGYLEAHIEQGPYLEEEGHRVGVVTTIVGSRTVVVTFEGEQNHAGTTPMPRRKDAGRAMTAFAERVHGAFPDHAGPRTVWTIGQMGLEPGAASIVPGRAWLNLQFRDPAPERLEALQGLALELVAEADAAGPVRVSARVSNEIATPAPMDPELRKHLAEAAERHAPGAWMELPSAAVHDAQILATRLPSAMLFVPSIGGVSHSFEEDTGEDDIALGCQVAATAAASILLARDRGSGIG